MAKTCLCCNNEFTLSLRDRLARGSINRLSGGFPLLKKLIIETEDWCNSCYHAAVDPVAQSVKSGLSIQAKTPVIIPPSGDYFVTLSLVKEDVKVKREVNLLSLESNRIVHDLIEKENYKLIDIDDPYSENPLNAVNVITKQRGVSRKDKKKKVLLVKYLMNQLGF